MSLEDGKGEQTAGRGVMGAGGDVERVVETRMAWWPTTLLCVSAQGSTL